MHWYQLQDFLRTKQADVRALIITGSGGKAFSTGRDLKESANHTPEDTKRYMQLAIDSAIGFQTLPMPTLCAINGHCFGWGVELAASCDLRFAADEATICFPETGLGIFPGAGGTVMLPRIVPMAVAKELIFTAKRIDGQEAQRVGLVTSSVPRAKLLDEVSAVAAKIASNGPLGVEAAKRVMQGTIQMDSFEEAMALSAKERFPLNATKVTESGLMF
jgi:enoyl-CoA hydratase/carnithine racemase